MGNFSRWFEKLTLSQRMSIGYALGLFITLSIFAFFLYERFHQSIHNSYDRHLKFEVRQIRPHVQVEDDGSISIDTTSLHQNDALTSTDSVGTHVRIIRADSSIIYKSPNLAGTASMSLRIPDGMQRSGGTFSRNWRNLPARTLVNPLLQDNHVVGWIETTGFEWALHRELVVLRRYLVLIIVLSVVFSLGGGIILSKKALQPISNIVHSAKSIRVDELDQRLPVNKQAKDELYDLATTLNAMLKRIQRGYERERQFSSDAAHELKTPLSSMRSDAEITLRREREPEKYRETLQRQLDEIKRMSRMVELLLKISRLESDRSFNLQAVEVQELVEPLLGDLKPIADEKSLSLSWNIEGGKELYIDPLHLEEIVHNLVNNAIKYTPEGGSIEVAGRCIGETIILEVTDDGIGFDQAEQQQLFDRFYRSDEADIQREEGHGLGLSLTKAIVEHYNGTIEAHSPGKGKGSTFRVELPCHTHQQTLV